MSSLTAVDKRYLEKILGMGSGYVLDFTDATFEEFFNRYGVDIHSRQYQKYGTSKAKKLSALWELESDTIVASVLGEMLEIYVANCHLECSEPDAELLAMCRQITAKLSGVAVGKTSEKGFLDEKFEIPDLRKLPVDPSVTEIIEDRLREAQSCVNVGAHLSVIFLCGSVLEAVLLGAAQEEPRLFNQSKGSPKREGRVKPFHEWSLSEFINVACEIGLLTPDIQKFSHGLREFRNYIHPYEQMVSKFKPDEHTANVCFHVLKAALASISGQR